MAARDAVTRYVIQEVKHGHRTVLTEILHGNLLALTSRDLARAIAQSDAKPMPHRAGRVLLVEDNAEVADVCTGYFQQLGYDVRRAESAQEALEMLENDPAVDLVFSDILMPGVMNGLELAKAIRDRFPQLPVLLSTGYSSSVEDAVRQGFVVLQKPFDIAALEKGLRDLARRKEPDDTRSERAAG